MISIHTHIFLKKYTLQSKIVYRMWILNVNWYQMSSPWGGVLGGARDPTPRLPAPSPPPGVIRTEACQPRSLVRGPQEWRSCMQAQAPDSALSASAPNQWWRRIPSARTSSCGQKKGNRKTPAAVAPRIPAALPCSATCRTSAVLATEDPGKAVWHQPPLMELNADCTTLPSQEPEMLQPIQLVPSSPPPCEAFLHWSQCKKAARDDCTCAGINAEPSETQESRETRLRKNRIHPVLLLQPEADFPNYTAPEKGTTKANKTSTKIPSTF